jgi:hypothetical protein
MSGLSLRRTTALCSVLAFAQPLSAQTLSPTVAPAAAEEEVGEIVVTGSILSAQEDSIALKRDALNLADIAASDSVGRFPDQNAAAALSRLPAVAVRRAQPLDVGEHRRHPDGGRG